MTFSERLAVKRRRTDIASRILRPEECFGFVIVVLLLF